MFKATLPLLIPLAAYLGAMVVAIIQHPGRPAPALTLGRHRSSYWSRISLTSRKAGTATRSTSTDGEPTNSSAAPHAQRGNIRAMAKGPLISLNHGTKMPTLGLGVLDRSVRELTAGAVEAASVDGYRLIDTAASYLNER
jgi:hypothetical protein